MVIYLIRHFPTAFNGTKQIMGDGADLSIDRTCEIPLMKKFRKECIEHYHLDRYPCYSSEAKRACETSAWLFSNKYTTDERLNPRGSGELMGKTIQEIKKLYPEAIDSRGKLKFDCEVPGVETIRHLQGRVYSFLKSVILQDRDIVVVSHSMTGSIIRHFEVQTSIDTSNFEELNFYVIYKVQFDSFDLVKIAATYGIE